MTNIERLVPHIVDLIDPRKWDRQVKLLCLVAAETWAHNGPVTLGTRRLAELLEEDAEAARWDLELLRRLASKHHRVLVQKANGRHPSEWRFAGNDPWAVLGWRNVPWSVPRSAISKEIRRGLWAVPVGLRAVDAGQEWFVKAAPAHRASRGAAWSRVFTPSEPPTLPHEPPTAPRPIADAQVNGGRETGTTAYSPTKIEELAAPPTSSSLILNDLSIVKGSERARELLNALQDQGHRVWGSLAERLATALDEPGAERELLAYVRGCDFRQTRSTHLVVESVLEWWAHTGRQTAARRAAVEAAVREAEQV